MSVSLKTQKTLWGRAAGRCSLPSCRKDVFHEEEDAPNPTLVGENCHIVAEKDGGTRGDPLFPIERRNEYANLILLCRNHHKVIDDVTNGAQSYPVDKLLDIKAEHEAWVRKNLEIDQEKQRDDEAYAGIIDDWEAHCHILTWIDWSSWVLSSGQPSISIEMSEDFKKARSRLLTRVWPARYPSLNAAFLNFRQVLEEFQNLFLSRCVQNGEKLYTEKFYKIREWDEARYFSLLRQYNYHVDLVQDLLLELTRAANLICDEIRRHFQYRYRLKEGKLSVLTGPNEALQFQEFVVEYQESEKTERYPFRGLEQFCSERQSRDYSFGEGLLPKS